MQENDESEQALVREPTLTQKSHVSLFFTLVAKILPLYINIGLGFLSARYLRVDKTSIATVLFYIIGPVVVFNATLSVQIDPAVAILPIFFYLFCSAIAFFSLRLFKRWWDDATPNILAFTAATGNTGFFGIALALILFEPAVADIFIFTVLASFFYESTTGFYIAAQGTYTARESMKKVLKLPVLYAFLAALILNIAGITLPEAVFDYTSGFKTIFSVLGMMVIGMGLKGLQGGDGVDLRFISISLVAKHILWPLAILSLILVDKIYLQLLNESLHMVMFVFAIVPLAGNTVTLAVLFKVRPQKAALTVLLSTLVSLVTIPLMLAFYSSL